MIGDAHSKGKRSSTTKPGPEFKKKHRAAGRAHEHVEGAPHSDGGGGKEKNKVAKKINSPMTGQRGPGVKDKQAPHKQRAFKEVEHLEPGDLTGQRHRAGRQLNRDNVEAWVAGTRGGYT